MGLTFFDMFAGVGGFRLGMEKAGHTCVGSCEWDKYSRQTYNKNFGHYPEYDDAKDMSLASQPRFDVLCAGFPCQAFSIAGKRMGFEDTRGTVFFEIARITREVKPSYLFLENVKGLLSHDKGRTFSTIISTLDEMGYDAEWQVLNSKYFVPQNRERIFIIGHLRGERTRQVFPLGDFNEISDKKKYRTEKLEAKTGLYGVVNDKKGLRSVNNSTCLDANYYKGHDYHGARTMICKPVLTPDREEKRQNGRRFKDDGEPAFTLNTQDRHGIYDGMKIRKLTPTECERLQGFPDDWTKGVSDTQRYRQMGNAVTVNVVEYIAKRLKLI